MLPALAEIALLIFEHGPKVQGAIKSAFSPGAGGTPIYGLHRYVPRNRVLFLRFSVFK